MDIMLRAGHKAHAREEPQRAGADQVIRIEIVRGEFRSSAFWLNNTST